MYHTKDVYLTAALLSLKFRLDKVDKTNPKQMEFYVSSEYPPSNFGEVEKAISSHNIHAIETEWTNKTLQVNAWEFSDALKRLKSIIHSS